MTSQANHSFTARRQARLERERDARLLWGEQCAEQILGMFIDIRVDLVWLGRFVSRIARQGGPTSRDKKILARAMVAARYGPPRAPKRDDATTQLVFDFGDSTSIRGRVAGERGVVREYPEGAA